MKAGELDGLRQLAPDVADCILPRLIVPPSSERDETAPLLLELGKTPDIAPRLAEVWRRRPALIDVSYIIDEFGRERMLEWLPPMFERARKREVRAIPIALLGDIGEATAAFRASIASDDTTKFGIRVPADQMVGSEFPNAIAEALCSLKLGATECVVVADFQGLEFTQPAIVSPIIRGVLENLQELGLWKQIIFQGSNYPETNPAPDGGVEFWPRNEWRAWRLAVKFDPTTADQMIFGDYGADCSVIEFASAARGKIRHLRYAAGENWRVERGAKHGSDRDSMHQVYTKIVRSADFAGASFSAADSYIAQAAADPTAPHGNSTTWRQLNTTHHITQLVSDIAKIRGVQIKPKPIDQAIQIPLLLTE
jgi:hypothetical protein